MDHHFDSFDWSIPPFDGITLHGIPDDHHHHAGFLPSWPSRPWLPPPHIPPPFPTRTTAPPTTSATPPWNCVGDATRLRSSCWWWRGDHRWYRDSVWNHSIYCYTCWPFLVATNCHSGPTVVLVFDIHSASMTDKLTHCRIVVDWRYLFGIEEFAIPMGGAYSERWLRYPDLFPIRHSDRYLSMLFSDRYWKFIYSIGIRRPFFDTIHALYSTLTSIFDIIGWFGDRPIDWPIVKWSTPVGGDIYSSASHSDVFGLPYVKRKILYDFCPQYLIQFIPTDVPTILGKSAIVHYSFGGYYLFGKKIIPFILSEIHCLRPFTMTVRWPAIRPSWWYMTDTMIFYWHSYRIYSLFPCDYSIHHSIIQCPFMCDWYKYSMIFDILFYTLTPSDDDVMINLFVHYYLFKNGRIRCDRPPLIIPILLLRPSLSIQ